MRALLGTLLCTIAVGCAHEQPAPPQSASAQQTHACKTTASHITHSDCSTSAPASQMTGEELDQERLSRGNGRSLGGIVTPH